MKHSLLIFIIIILTILPSCQLLRDKGLFNKKANTLELLKARQDSLRIADSLRVAQDQLLASENARLDSIQRATEERLAAQSRYNIIVGSFITPEFAKTFADEYRREGYDTRIIPLEGTGFELVSAESHGDFRKAVSRLSQFQDTVQFDAWLYIRN